MASISNDPNGTRRVLFVAPDGSRKAIRLAKVPKRLAEEVKVKVEHLAAAKAANLPLDNETAVWVRNLGDGLAAKLAAVALVDARASSRLGDFLATYIERRTDIKPRTRINLETCRARLVEFFGADRDLKSITPAAADRWVLWLRERYANGTTARTLKRAKQFFIAAVRVRLLNDSPFAGVKGPTDLNRSRQAFVTHDEVRKVMQECSSLELRVILALARFGGLRIPSELAGLTWQDVDWEKARVRVTSPKTEHHEGRGERFIPLFPEPRPLLGQAYEAAPEGALYVVGERYRNGDINHRTPLLRAIRRAGLTPWPKLFVNLRSSRETELVEEFPTHVVTAWLGNTEIIAQRHTCKSPTSTSRGPRRGGAAAQKATHRRRRIRRSKQPHHLAPSRKI